MIIKLPEENDIHLDINIEGSLLKPHEIALLFGIPVALVAAVLWWVL